MSKFILSTDSTADLYIDYMDKNDIKHTPLTYTIEENGAFTDGLDNFTTIEQYKAFYDKLRSGAVSRTSMLNYECHYNHFLKLASEGAEDVVHFTISMGLSPTVTVANQAYEAVKKLYPKFRVFAITSMSATRGQGILVQKALDMRNADCTAEETAKACEDAKMKLQHFIIASDLKYLQRGGRVSLLSANIGTLLGIRPILIFTKEGKLEVVDKERGMKKSFDYVIEQIRKFKPVEKNYMTIVHNDAEAKALELAEIIKREIGIEPQVAYMGPIIGSHVGPDAVSVAYISDSERPM